MKRTQVLYLPISPCEIKLFTINLSSSLDYAMLVMNVCRYILSNSANVTEKELCTNREYIKIIYRKMPRCFIYVSQNKYISFVFPFRYSTDSFWFKNDEVDCREVSEIYRLLYMLKGSPLFALYVDNGNDWAPFSEKTFRIVDGIFRTEAGYVRHENDRQHENGQVHPLNHFDVNISSDAAFKIGAYEMFTKGNFEKIFDNNSSCFYLDSYKTIGLYSKKIKKKKHSGRKP